MKLAFGNVEFFPPHWNYDFMGRKKLFIGISVALVVASFLLILVKGVNYSIDFLGGAELTLQFKDGSVHRDQLVAAAESAAVGNVEVTTVGNIGIQKDGEFLLRIQHDKNLDKDGTTTRVDTLKASLAKTFGADKFEIKSINNISGKIGKEEEIKGYLALLLACLGILAYISLRFDSRFAPGAVLCLVHDVIIALGFMTALGKPFSTSSIAAFLTIVGYSINDTVIVYDRIRETQTTSPKMGIVEVINSSISQTMNRTILTSSTGLMGLLVLILLGGGALEDFALTMFVGILVGSYSSIYVAAPLTIVMEDILKKMGWVPKDRSQKAKVIKDPNYSPPVLLKKKS
jgi:preprotein translocase subunit SecF